MAAKKKKESETALSKSIRDALTALGIWNIRIQSGMLRIGARFIHLAPKGTADVLLPSYDGKGRGVWIEIKTSDGTVSEDQIKFQDKCRQENVKSAIVHSVSEAIDTVKNWIKEDNK